MRKYLFLFFISLLLFLLVRDTVAQIPSNIPCATCHTMHYSEAGAIKPSWGQAGPYNYLLTNDCIGCHSNNTGATIKDGYIPVVYNTVPPAEPLAGGNFYYLINSDQNGHNPVEVGNTEDTLLWTPGEVHAGQVSPNELTCAGTNGCHGIRQTSPVLPGLQAIRGTHHQNMNGKLDNPTGINDSYRFLRNVKGYEINDWKNNSSTHHNEYSGAVTPMDTNQCSSCHDSTDITKIRPQNATISGFCATCHGNFHSSDPTVVGASSPFMRHPTDVLIPTGAQYGNEYTAYTVYNVTTPVARQVIPNASSGTVTPGVDIVMCLSCHYSHSGPYYKMMRWDYKNWPGQGTNGCGICHSSKN